MKVKHKGQMSFRFVTVGNIRRGVKLKPFSFKYQRMCEYRPKEFAGFIIRIRVFKLILLFTFGEEPKVWGLT